MKRRIFAAFIAAVMALALALPALALGSREIVSGECGNDLIWTLDTETGVLTISGTGEMDEYIEDEEWSPWFPYHSYITDIEICPGVTSIGEGAFYLCSLATSVSIPETVTRLSYMSFEDCDSLESVIIPSGVTIIQDWVFGSCDALSSAIFLGASPSYFGEYVFDYCSYDFCIYYTAEHAGEWAPNGETTLNGYPIALYEGGTAAPGDASGDGNIGVDDALLVPRAAMGMIPSNSNIDACDVNGDGVVNLNDALLILRYAMGVIAGV